MKALIDWFQRGKRTFPWREDPTPYSVWVSEIMLQQTRAEVVVDYYLAWMQKFPNLQALALSAEEEVIKAWEGLGYYSRARNLHKAARVVVERGSWPKTREEWESLPGVGTYTAGAILSFAFQQKAVAMDANVFRVASRFFYKETDLPKEIEAMLPDDHPHIAMEALIELGATVCKKEPFCERCPLKEGCKAFAKSDVTAFPIPKKREKTTILYRHLFCITDGRRLFLQKGDKGKLMADLWQFPYKEVSAEEYEQGIALHPFPKMDFLQYLEDEEQTFTRYKAKLRPMLFFAEESPWPGQWVEMEQVRALPFCSGHRRVLQQLLPAY